MLLFPNSKFFVRWLHPILEMIPIKIILVANKERGFPRAKSMICNIASSRKIKSVLFSFMFQT